MDGNMRNCIVINLIASQLQGPTRIFSVLIILVNWFGNY